MRPDVGVALWFELGIESLSIPWWPTAMRVGVDGARGGVDGAGRHPWCHCRCESSALAGREAESVLVDGPCCSQDTLDNLT